MAGRSGYAAVPTDSLVIDVRNFAVLFDVFETPVSSKAWRTPPKPIKPPLSVERQ